MKLNFSVGKNIGSLYRDKYVLSRSAIVVGASLIGNVFAYLFQLLSGRYFSVADYSELVSLFSLSTVIPLGIFVFTNGVAKVVAEIKDDDYPNRVSSFFYSLMSVNAVISVFVFVSLMFLRNKIASYLHIDNIRLITVFITSLSIAIIASAPVAFLQGLLRFKSYSFVTIVSYLLRFAIILVVIFKKLSLVEVYMGLIVVAIIMFFTNMAFLKKNIVYKLQNLDFIDLRLLVKYSVGGAFAIVGISFLQNFDILLVKHFFDATTAGIYSSTTIVGRIIFFAASPITIVMLPICAQKYKKGEDALKPFFITLALTIFVAGSITIFYSMFPEFTTKLLFGKKYLPGAVYLPLYSLFMLIFSVLNIVAQFLVAVSKFKESAVVMVAGILQILGIYIFHESLTQVIVVSILSISISTLLLAPPIFQMARKKD